MEGLALLTDGFVATFGTQGGTPTVGGSSQAIEGKIIGQTSASGKITTSNIIRAKVDNTDEVSGVKTPESTVSGKIIDEDIIQGKVDE